MENAISYKNLYRDQLMSYPNVVGIGVGNKVVDGEVLEDEVIVVMVERKLPLSALSHTEAIPTLLGEAHSINLDGDFPKFESQQVPTDVIQVGHIVALPTMTDKGPTDKWRPAPGGVSIGHYRITAGTLGCIVKDKETGQRLILSNNHVLADSNEGVVGDSILQPGPYDGGGEPGDIIGRLGRFVRIDFGEDDSLCPLADKFAQLSNYAAKMVGSSHRVKPYQFNPRAVNLVDAAIAVPINDEDVLDVIWGGIGVVDGVVDGHIGMDVAKYGRTTEYTVGKILLTNATIKVGYGGSKVATFENQFVAGAMSAGGDSGSLVVEIGSSKAVGLLFAGSDQATIFSPISLVLNALNVGF